MQAYSSLPNLIILALTRAPWPHWHTVMETLQSVQKRHEYTHETYIVKRDNEYEISLS